MAYNKKVLEHYDNPRNVGRMNEKEKNVGTGLVGAPACGDVMRLQIKVSEEGIIEDAKFKTYGCFVSNTYINTPTEEVKISNLKINDIVLAWNGKNIVSNKIKKIIKQQVKKEELLIITFEKKFLKDKNKFKIFNLICTKEHVFWNKENKPILAKNISKNTKLYTLNNDLENVEVLDIKKIKNEPFFKYLEKDKEGIWVYDLILEEGAHVYFAKGVGSHNCGSAIASSSLVTEWVKGLSLNEAEKISNTQICEELALPPVKIHCSILAEDAIRAAIEDYKNKNN